MKRLVLLISAVLLLAVSMAPADVIVSDDFESYASTSAMSSVWISDLNATVDESILVTDFGNSGQSGFNPGTLGGWPGKNVNEQFFDAIEPTEDESIRFRADIYDDAGSTNERQTIGLRAVNELDETANILEMGFYNATPAPFFTYRVQLVQGGVGDGNVDWQLFSLPDNYNSPGEVGPGWHRFEAIIRPDSIQFSVDLHTDGTIDAVDVVNSSVWPLPEWGFNNIRWGGPSGVSSLGGGAHFDNILLETFVGCMLGDVNLDGEVNGLDVEPFVGLVLSGELQCEADMNEDGAVNGLDVDSFVDLVVSGGAEAVPEPSALVLLGAGLLILAGVRRRCR